ncbi:sensor histidine kinase [Geofilum sp. OHC36d9]|uniref:sensor histidine kinase n=1 Tax=Geofilum sp. OHC36d9 TaxID=3458413 RepID=UPI004034B215
MKKNRFLTILQSYRRFVKQQFKAPSSSKGPLEKWQSVFLSELMVYILPLAFIVYIPSLIMSVKTGLIMVAVYDTIAFIMVYAITFTNSIHFRHKKRLILFTLYSLGLVLLGYMGWMGPGLIYLVSFSVLSSLLINKKAGLITFFGNILVFIILVIGSIFNLFDNTSLYDIEPASAGTIGLNYLLLNLVMVMANHSLTKALQKKIQGTRRISQRLKEEMTLHLHAREKAEESDRLKSAFLANMSHEIRTPLNGVVGFTQLLRDPELNTTEKDEYLDIIEKSGERLLAIINDLIDISKIEANQVTINKTPINIPARITEIIHFFKPEAQSKNLNLIFDVNHKECNITINTDGNKVDAILTNLIKNALKFTQRGYIKAGCYVQNNQVIIYVEDSGIGISTDKKAAIFERFIQVGDSKAAKGSGLGLAISKGYIELLGGTIQVETEPGKGSKFSFTLPVT